VPNRKARRRAGKHLVRQQSPSGGRHRWGLAATATAALLAPALLTSASAGGWVTAAGKDALLSSPDKSAVLQQLRKAQEHAKTDVNGSLPAADQAGAQLLQSAADPAQLASQVGPLADLPQGPLGIPGVVLDAYLKAQQRLASTMPNCHLDWSLLAGIGRIESGHARGGQVDANGTTLHPILGPVLNGGADVAAIRDTDGGRWDGDPVWDRAVGPMQFIPSTWVGYATLFTGHNGGTPNPNNVYDSAVAAGYYLCAGGGDLHDPVQRAQAVFRYNHSDSYVSIVLVWADAYATGVTPLPAGSSDYPDPGDAALALPGPVGPATVPGPPPSNAGGSPSPTTPTTTTDPTGTTTSTPAGTTTSAPPASSTTVTLVPTSSDSPTSTTTTTTAPPTTTTTTSASAPPTTTTSAPACSTPTTTPTATTTPTPTSTTCTPPASATAASGSPSGSSAPVVTSTSAHPTA
jgi:membrane-bound lytic murein transglycosylase B